MWDPAPPRHVLHGALAGGPYADDSHVDATHDYVSNEVALDYNAALVGALAGFCELDGTDVTTTSTVGPAPSDAPYAVDAWLEREHHKGSWIRIAVRCEPRFPPRYTRELSVRYFFDLGAVRREGRGVEAVTVELAFDDTARVRGPIAWDAARDLYYVELTWPDQPVWGTRELVLALHVTALPGTQGPWQPLDDWSRGGLTGTRAPTERIPIYIAGQRVFGVEPP